MAAPQCRVVQVVEACMALVVSCATSTFASAGTLKMPLDQEKGLGKDPDQRMDPDQRKNLEKEKNQATLWNKAVIIGFAIVRLREVPLFFQFVDREVEVAERKLRASHVALLQFLRGHFSASLRFWLDDLKEKSDYS